MRQKPRTVGLKVGFVFAGGKMETDLCLTTLT